MPSDSARARSRRRACSTGKMPAATLATAATIAANTSTRPSIAISSARGKPAGKQRRQGAMQRRAQRHTHHRCRSGPTRAFSISSCRASLAGAGAKRCANGQLAMTRGRARQLHVGHVGNGRHEEQGGSNQQNDNGRPHVCRGRLVRFDHGDLHRFLARQTATSRPGRDLAPPSRAPCLRRQPVRCSRQASSAPARARSVRASRRSERRPASPTSAATSGCRRRGTGTSRGMMPTTVCRAALEHDRLADDVLARAKALLPESLRKESPAASCRSRPSAGVKSRPRNGRACSSSNKLGETLVTGHARRLAGAGQRHGAIGPRADAFDGLRRIGPRQVLTRSSSSPGRGPAARRETR